MVMGLSKENKRSNKKLKFLIENLTEKYLMFSGIEIKGAIV